MLQLGKVTPPGVSGVTWNLYQYFPANSQTPASSSPYLYFKAVAGQYAMTVNSQTTYNSWTQPSDSQKITAFKDSKAWDSTVNAYAWVNPKLYQVLCPGLDGKYGRANNGTGPSGTDPGGGGIYAPLYPDGTNYSTSPSYITDDMGNFTTGTTVGDDMP